MSNNETSQISGNKRFIEGLDDQLDRLNSVIQNFVVNLDASRSNQISCNISNSFYPNMSDVSLSDAEIYKFENKFEETLQENDQLKMIIEDFCACSLRSISEICCTCEEISFLLSKFKDLLFGPYNEVLIPIGKMNMKFKIINKDEFSEKSKIKETIESNSKSGNLSYGELLQKIYFLQKENLSLAKINEGLFQNFEIFDDMKSKFVIQKEKVLIKNFCIENSDELKKAAALEIELKKYQKKNILLEKAQEVID